MIGILRGGEGMRFVDVVSKLSELTGEAEEIMAVDFIAQLYLGLCEAPKGWDGIKEDLKQKIIDLAQLLEG